MRGREAKVKTMTREEVSAPPRRRPPEVARAEERKRKERGRRQRLPSERERENELEGRRYEFIYIF